MKLPSVEGKIRRRPGPGKKTKQSIYIPDEKKYPKFWREWYEALDSAGVFAFPIANAERAIDPFFGFYGYRFQPIDRDPQSFHVGVNFRADSKTPVMAIADGVLEYSGFDIVNGNYVMLSHPGVNVQDSGKLVSLSMHMRANVVRFTSYQKMLREISLHTYPEIKIAAEEVIGEVGDSGNIEGYDTHLHLQIQLQRPKGGVIALDPARVLGILPKENLTATLANEEEFESMYQNEKKSITDWNLTNYWQNNGE